MHAVVRKYSGKGAKELFVLLEKNGGEIKSILGSIKGFVSYTLAHSEDGGFTVTVCKDKAGIDESVRLAKDWIAKNAPKMGVGAPEVTKGKVAIHMG